MKHLKEIILCVLVLAICISGVSYKFFKWGAEKITGNGANINATVEETSAEVVSELEVPLSYNLILPEDIARDFKISLSDMSTMSKSLYEKYPDNTDAYYSYERVDIEEDNNVFFFKGNSGQSYRVGESIDESGVKSYKVDKIGFYTPTETRNIPESAKSIYEYTPDMIDKLSDYVREDGHESAELVSVEELKCCYYIYFTVDSETRYIRVDKESELITVRGEAFVTTNEKVGE